MLVPSEVRSLYTERFTKLNTCLHAAQQFILWSECFTQIHSFSSSLNSVNSHVQFRTLYINTRLCRDRNSVFKILYKNTKMFMFTRMFTQQPELRQQPCSIQNALHKHTIMPGPELCVWNLVQKHGEYCTRMFTQQPELRQQPCSIQNTLHKHTIMPEPELSVF